MSTDLREELDALARTQTFSPDPSAWDRGRRARRRTRLAAGLAAVAVVAVVAGGGALALRPRGPSGRPRRSCLAVRSRAGSTTPTDRPLEPTSRSGARRWPSSTVAATVLVDASRRVSRTSSICRTSRRPTVFDPSSDRRRGHRAGAGRPDGRRLACPTIDDRWSCEPGQLTSDRVAPRRCDLTTGESDPSRLLRWGDADRWPCRDDCRRPDRRRRVERRRPRRQGAGTSTPWTVDPAIATATGAIAASVAPGGGSAAPSSSDDDPVRGDAASRPAPHRPGPHAARRPLPRRRRGHTRSAGPRTPRRRRSSTPCRAARRADRAWRCSTSPDRPESEWTYRSSCPRLPRRGSAQPRRRPRPRPRRHLLAGADPRLRGRLAAGPFGIELSLFIGLGVAAAIAVLLALRWLWRRLLVARGPNRRQPTQRA